MKRLFIILFIFILIPVHANLSQPQSIDGSWKGSISILGTELQIFVKFNTEPDSLHATIDIPQQGAKDLKLVHVVYSLPGVHFELPAGQSVAVFDGDFANDSIKGAFTQSGLNGAFYLIRGEEIIETPEDTAVLPYYQEEVSFTNGDIKFAGTLTIPKTKGKYPAIVMITGSGSHNRDEEILGFKIFRVIADHFTRKGIAVLRYDDRGVGGSTGKSKMQYTTDDLSGDVLEAIKYLKTRNDINPEQIGLCGHSEGGIIAPLAASKSGDIAFIVLMAGTGVKGIDILKEQSKLIMLANGGTQDEVNANSELLDKTYQAVETDTGWDEVESLMIKTIGNSFDKMPEEQKKNMKDKDEYVKNMVTYQMNEMKIPWMKFFIQYDPIIALGKVKCPVLMIFGENDLQVPPKQNKEIMENALKESGNKDYMSVLIPKANHLFQSATTGSPEEYGKLPKEFAPGFLETMSGWILKHVTMVK